MVRWLVVAVLVCTAGCSGSGSGTPAAPPTAAPSPSVVVDANAREACNQLAQASVLHEAGKTEKPAGGYGEATSEMQATSAELKALDLALKSTVPEVRQIGMDAGPVSALRSWCQNHNL